MNKQPTPWHDKDGNLRFPYRPLRDVVFIWPLLPEKLGKEELISIPEHLKTHYHNGSGILLGVGPGYYGNDGKWHPTTDQLRPGVKIQYDQTVPWNCWLEDLEGKDQLVTMCTVSDIKGILEE